jgi:uncharacterized membrane protein (GlpM family)
MNNWKTRTNKPIRKFYGAAAGGMTIGPSLAVLVIYVAESASGKELPEAIQASIAAIIIYAVTLASMYFTPPAPEDAPIPDRA